MTMPEMAEAIKELKKQSGELMATSPELAEAKFKVFNDVENLLGTACRKLEHGLSLTIGDLVTPPPNIGQAAYDVMPDFMRNVIDGMISNGQLALVDDRNRG
jgi:hypothetical protein